MSRYFIQIKGTLVLVRDLVPSLDIKQFSKNGCYEYPCQVCKYNFNLQSHMKKHLTAKELSGATFNEAALVYRQYK